MRNKKLISMLMLSAGFVACQDEIVENEYAGNEVKKDLVEDVVLSVSFADDAITRAAYAGKWDADKEYVYPYENFYLTPDFKNDGTLDLSNNVSLKGDMIGYCLTNEANAITNYPFYIAGYGAPDLVGEGDDPTVTKNVYVFANQTDGNNPLYVLNIGEDQTVKEIVTTETETTQKAVIEKAAANAASVTGVAGGALDVTKGILRTNTGIMKGDYVAYFPYDENFVEPGGIKVKGEAKMVALFEAGDISGNTDEQKALASVNKVTADEVTTTYSFYDYMFAVSSNTTPVAGGKAGGEVTLIPRTSVFTFAISNVLSADATEEQLTAANQTIKRITVRPDTEDATIKPFFMGGYVPLTGLLTMVGDAVTAENLIGVSFDDLNVYAEAEVVEEEAEAVAEDDEDVVTPNSVYYVSIPFYPDVNYTGKYLIEVYNTNGEVLTIKSKNTGALALGKAYISDINLADGEFKDAVRKIFDANDFQEEALAGGQLELMANVEVPSSFAEQVEEDLEIISNGKTLTLRGGTYSGAIKMDGGKLVEDGAIISGDIDAKDVTVTSKTTGNISATKVTLSTSSEYIFNNSIVATDLILTNGTMTLNNADVTTLTVESGATASVVKRSWVDEDEVTKNSNVEADNVVNKGTLNVSYLKAGVVRNGRTLTVVTEGELTATSIKNESFVESGSYNGHTTYYIAEFTVEGKTSNATFGNQSGTLIWASTDDMNLDITNSGTFNMSSPCNWTGTLTNNGTATLGAFAAVSGNITNNKNLNFNGNVNVIGTEIKFNAGAAVIAADATMSGKSTVLSFGADAELIKIASEEDYLDEFAGTDKFQAKFTAVRVNSPLMEESTADTDNSVKIVTTKKLYLAADAYLNVANGSSFADIEVEGSAEIAAAGTTAKSITINENQTLTLSAGSYINVEGNVLNNGIYNGVGSTVDCADFSGNGTWTDNVTPNC